MISEFKLSLYKQPDGSLLVEITSVPKEPNKFLKDAIAYEKKYRAMLDAMRPYTRARIVIQSHGGEMNSALGLMSALRGISVPCTLLIRGYAESAAAMIAFGLDNCPVYITPGASVMMHMPKVQKYSKKGGIWTVVGRLTRASTVNMLVKIFADACHAKKKVVREWLESNKRFNPHEMALLKMIRGVMTQDDFMMM